MKGTISRPSGDAVLVTWLAKSSDPYVRQRPTFHRYVEKDGQRIDGPLLEALFHGASPLRGCLTEVYLCWREATDTSDEISEKEVLAQTMRELRAQGLKHLRITPIAWQTNARPIDHDAIWKFVKLVLKRVREEHPEAHIYIHSSPGTTAMSNVWVILGATGYISGAYTLLQGIPERFRDKHDSPVVPIGLQVESWLKRYRRSRPSVTSAEDDGSLIERTEMSSPALISTLDSLERWAQLRVPLLLIGERGTGKTTLANYVRGLGPFQSLGSAAEWPVAVCGQFQVDVNMARSELFGHEKGAFTGADAPRRGLLELADGDCLFLDEIGDIDKATQRLLVAAIEGRGFRPLGGERTVKSRFRLICATNRSLADLSTKLLDEDFFDRIRYAVVEVPPLRRCREDIPWFWRRVLRRAATEAELQLSAIGELDHDPELLSALQEHHLPGNLRDLYRVAFHLFAALQGGATRGEAVSEALKSLDCKQDRVHSNEFLPDIANLAASLPLEMPVTDLFTAYRTLWITAAMSKSDRVISRAAELLGVKRKTFENWVRSLERGE